MASSRHYLTGPIRGKKEVNDGLSKHKPLTTQQDASNEEEM